VILRSVFSLPEEMATEFQLRLKELILEFNARPVETTTETKQYNFIMALHPIALEAREDSGIDPDSLSTSKLPQNRL